jgi:hypothetical protein
MSRFLKIHTASSICTAYIFRLLFVTIAFIASVNTARAASVKSNYASFADRSVQHVKPLDNQAVSAYAMVEIAEEDSDDNDPLKLDASMLPQFFYFLPGSGIMDQPKAIRYFDKCFTYNSSPRYIELRVFRI